MDTLIYHKYMEVINTERLLIRRPAEADLQDFLAYRNDSEVLKFLPIQPIDEDTALNNLKKQVVLDEAQATGWIMFAIELKTEKKMIGEVGVYISPIHKSCGDIGWSVNKNYHGNGYAVEGAGAFLAYIFELRGLDRVTATCVSANTASSMLMTRLGMHKVANHVQNQYIDKVRHDEQLYTISRAEWLEKS